MTFNVADIVNQAAAQTTENMNEAVAKAAREPIPEGKRRARFVAYYETGKHTKSGKDRKTGKPFKTQKNLAVLVFELLGPKDEPREIDGVLVPNTVKVEVNLARSDRSLGFKLFGIMNWKGTAKIFPQLLGEVYLVEVFNNTVGEGAEARTYSNLRDPNGNSTIQPPKTVNEEGEEIDVSATCKPAITPYGVFLWDFATKAMWDAIFIDGTYGEGGASKNWIQNTISKADNFDEIKDIVAGGDALALGLGDAETPQRAAADVQAAQEREQLVNQGKASTVTGAAAADPLASL